MKHHLNISGSGLLYVRRSAATFFFTLLFLASLSFLTGAASPTAFADTVPAAYPEYEAAGEILTLSGDFQSFHARYTDAYFCEPAETEQGDLAILSCLAAGCLSSEIPGGQNPAIPLLSGCGFSFITEDGFDDVIFSAPGNADGFSTLTDNDHCRLLLAYKRIQQKNDSFAVIAVLVSGYSEGRYEWISNFNLGPTPVHEGFNKAAEEARLVVKTYTQKVLALTGCSRVRYWLAGHSRGGAIVNLLAPALTGSLPEGAETDKNDIYAFGFATPAGIQKKKAIPSDNIRNYLIPGDLVPALAPSGIGWGYGRNGTDVYLERHAVRGMSGFYKINHFFYAGNSVFERNRIVRSFRFAGISRRKYTEEYKQLIYTASPEDFCKNGIALLLTEGHAGEGAALMMRYARIEPLRYGALVSGLIRDGLLLPGIIHAHCIDAYLSFLQAYYRDM